MQQKVDINTLLTIRDESCRRRHFCPTRTGEMFQVVGFGTNYTRYWENEGERKQNLRDIKENV
jgi:hypothetical protein